MDALVIGFYALISRLKSFFEQEGRDPTQYVKRDEMNNDPSDCHLTKERNRTPNSTSLRVSPEGHVSSAGPAENGQFGQQPLWLLQKQQS